MPPKKRRTKETHANTFGDKADLDKRLIDACCEGKTDVATTLLARGAAVDAIHGWTALMSASASNSVETVLTLLECGASIDVIACGGWSGLMVACMQGCAEVVAALLDRGATIEASDRHGRTAVLWAAQKSRFDIEAMLLSHNLHSSKTLLL